MIRRWSSREYLHSNDCVAVKQKADFRNRDVMMRLGRRVKQRSGNTAFLSNAKRCRQVSDRWIVIDGFMDWVIPVGRSPKKHALTFL